MQKFDYSQCNEDDSPLWDDVMKNNNIKAFMTVFENNRTKSSEIIYKNISEILSNIPEFANENKINKTQCQKYITKKVNQMINKYDYKKYAGIIDEKYFSEIKESLVESWLKGHSVINRIDIFKISFALDLPAFEPTNEKNKILHFSHEALFNRVFNQRYCVKHADDICFNYCKKKHLSYETALDLFYEYTIAPKDKIVNKESKIESTKNILDIAMTDLNEKQFLDVLISYHYSFCSEQSAINKKLIKRIEEFEDSNKLKKYNIKYNSIKSSLVFDEELFNIIENTRCKALEDESIKKDVKTNMLAFSKHIIPSDSITINIKNNLLLIEYLLSHNESINKLINDEKSPLWISEELSSDNNKNKKFLLKAKRELNLINDLVLSANIRNSKKYKEINNNSNEKNGKNEKVYSWQINNDQPSRDYSYYDKMRKLIIFVSFFHYFIDYIDNSYDLKKEKSISEGFINEVNDMLLSFQFNELYPFNSFDLFFILCIKTSDPIFTYYYILKYYIDKYYIDKVEDIDLIDLIYSLGISKTKPKGYDERCIYKGDF